MSIYHPRLPLCKPRHTSCNRFFAGAFSPLSVITIALLTAYPALAQTQLPTVEIKAQTSEFPSTTKVTEAVEALPTSTTVLGRRDLDNLSISTYGDMFRNVTGAFVNDYGQGLVAYEVKMRGFGSGHGRDIAFTLDGVPLNITGSQHTNGYADLAQIIAETVSRVEIIRGPFSVTSGNHAVAGSVNFFTDRNTPSMVKVDVDSFGRVRVLPILSQDVGPGRLLLALDATQGNGYQDQTGLKRTNFLTRYSLPIGNGQASVRLQVYDAKADAPGYIDYAKVLNGSISPRAALAPGIGDTKKQSNIVANFRSDDAEGLGGIATGWQASVYGVRDDRRRYTFYDLSNPIGAAADLGAERDRLRQHGFDIRKATMLGSAAQPAQLLLGLQYNNEVIDALNFVADSQRVSRGNALVGQQRDAITRTTALYGQYQISPVQGLKLVAGLRYDQIKFAIGLKALDDNFAAGGINNFSNTKNQFSPKLGFGYALGSSAQPIEVFGNVARGLKTPYPYGDYNRLPDSNITPLTSSELGLQGSVGQANWRVAVWRTQQDKEALFNSANLFIGNQRTDRNGFDLEGGYAIASGVKLTANYSSVKARVLGQGVNDRITNVPNWTAGLGIEGFVATTSGQMDWSLKDTIVGPQPLVADNSAATEVYHRITARIGFAPIAIKGAKFALSLTHYDRPYEETRFDFGGGVYGISAKPNWKVLASALYAF